LFVRAKINNALGVSARTGKPAWSSIEESHAGTRFMDKYLIIRCAIPNCVWGYSMPSMEEWSTHPDHAREAFRRHCVQRHGLDTDDMDVWVHFNIVNWTMELVMDGHWCRGTCNGVAK
jgi:hypothetical protein